MRSKEALNLFKQYQWSIKDKNKALEILEELVERDTPMKVLRVDDGGMRVKGYDHHSPYCPSCNNRIYNESFNREKHNTNFCPKCGQRLDWSE